MISATGDWRTAQEISLFWDTKYRVHERRDSLHSHTFRRGADLQIVDSWLLPLGA